MKRHAPATERNREPIAAVLRDVLPVQGLVLEIASGSGEHALHFARAFPQLRWQPSDPDPEALSSIEAWAADEGPPNLLEPVELDAAGTWPVDHADAVLCINMVHISPWSATKGLMRQAAGVLPDGAPLMLYGPYRQRDVPTAPSNEAFDRSLKQRNPAWGLRLVEEVEEEGARSGLSLHAVHRMPTNNLMLVFRKT